MSRDNDRTQVYTAEDLSAELTVLVQPMPITRLQHIVELLLSSAWWARHFDSAAVTVVENRSGQQSYYTAATRTISLSPRACDLNTLCHELGHVAAADRRLGGQTHGPAFRSLHVLIRTAIAGEQSGVDLAAVYGQFGLDLQSPEDISAVNQPSILGDRTYEAAHVVRPSDRPQRSSRGLGPHRPPIAL